jgi:lipopolysaccharide transport system ATP-binding protein
VRQSNQEVFWALRNVAFEIRRGETVGIVGRNGAGKSTLLKILSRITEPSEGKAKIRGRIGSLLEVGTGFHPELTGRENVYLSGAILGMRKVEIDRKFDDIVAFAEIDEFIETPVKRYSSGMYVRLAFAVAAHLDPDILLLDEVLSVGDLAFQRKCIQFAKSLHESNRTILFVSHNMFSTKAMCSRVIYLSKGEVRFDGLPEPAIELFETENRVSTATQTQTEQLIGIKYIELLDFDGRSTHVFNHGQRMRIRLTFEALDKVKNANIGVGFIRSDNVGCCNFNTAMDGFTVPALQGRGTIELITPPLKLVSELYEVHVMIWDVNCERLYSSQVCTTFHVRHDLLNTHFGVFHESAEWHWVEGCRADSSESRTEELEDA